MKIHKIYFWVNTEHSVHIEVCRKCRTVYPQPMYHLLLCSQVITLFHLSASSSAASLFPQSSLAICSRCGERITDRVLKAVGQCFHAHCFRCSTCSCVLEGAPFITDDNNNPYCVQDYHRWPPFVECSVINLLKHRISLLHLITNSQWFVCYAVQSIYYSWE